MKASIKKNIFNPSFQRSPSPAEKSGFYFCMANSGNIVKAKCDKDFTTIFNSVLRDERISLRARGLLAYIISLPSDWVIQKSYLDSQIFPDVKRLNENGKRVQGEKREGRDAVFSAFNELVEFGYIQAVRKVNPESGRSEGFDYIVYSYPIIENRVSDYPISENQVSEEPQLTKEIVLQKKESNKKEIYKEKIIENARTFYKTELEQNSGHQHIEGYKQVANFIFLKNPFGKPIVGILSLENQLKFSDYLKILDKNEYNITGILDMLANMANTPSYTKGKVSLFLTLNNWINREKKKK